jgi:CRISPR system Cascade subunit CasD
MVTLLLRLQGPMQSWGTTSRFDERDTQLEPSKSGVLGLICAALGRDRSEDIQDLANLRMGVRSDHEGVPMRDYQTVGGSRDPKRKTLLIASGDTQARTVVSPRFYLADAAFLVGLEGENRSLLETVHTALRTPVWPLALGRKSFVPGSPVHLADGLQEWGLMEALRSYPRLVGSGNRQRTKRLRISIENEGQGSMRLDQPIAPFAERRFGPRFVRSEVIDVSDSPNT